MFNSIFRKLFWKEFRTLWPLWMAVAMLCMFINLGVFLGWDEPGQISTRNYWIFLTAALLPALYGLGSAGTQFAWELDAGTFRRLRTLPVTSGQVAWAKLAWTIVSTILLGVTLWGAAFLWTGGKGISSKTTLTFFNVYSFATLEAIAWGTIVSLRSRSPLVATIIAGAVAILVFGLEMSVFMAIKLNGSREQWSTYANAWPIRLTVLILLIIVLIYLARRWFDYWRQRESEGNEHGDLFGIQSHIPKYYLTGDGGFMALCQQCWRRNFKFWLIAGLSNVAVAIFFLLPYVTGNMHPSIGFISLLIGIGGVTIASNVFGADQSDRGFRFFAHHGVKTRSVWLSRILLSGVLFLVPWCIIVVMYICYFSSHTSPVYTGMVLQRILLILFDVSLAVGACLFFVGAFFSITCQSRVLAWTWTLGLSIGCGILANFLWDYQVSILSMLVLALGFMLSSYRSLFNKIHDRTGFRAWLKVLSPLATFSFIFVCMVIGQRVHSIPNVVIREAWLKDYKLFWKQAESLPSSPPVEDFKAKTIQEDRPRSSNLVWHPYLTTRSDLAQSLKTIEDFEGQKVQVDQPLQWIKTQIGEPFDGTISIFRERELEKTLYVADLPEGIDWGQVVFRSENEESKREILALLKNLRDHLFRTAEYYSRIGEPKKSLDCLLAAITLSPPAVKANTSIMVFDVLPKWSVGPGVTPKLIEKTIRRVQQLEPPGLHLQRLILAEYLYNQETLNDSALISKRKDPTHQTFFAILPWELARTKRLSKLSAVRAIELLEFWFGRTRFIIPKTHGMFSDSLQPLNEWINQRHAEEVEQVSGIFRDVNMYYFCSIDVASEIGSLWQAELFRRLALASLAIRADQLRHYGVLPGTISNVDHYLSKPSLLAMPCGPAFGFRSEGFTEKQCVQPGLCIKANEFGESKVLYERPSLVSGLAGTPCIVLDTRTLYEAYGLFPDICPEAGGDKILQLPDNQFYSVPTVYPLPFGEKKHEKEKED